MKIRFWDRLILFLGAVITIAAGAFLLALGVQVLGVDLNMLPLPVRIACIAGGAVLIHFGAYLALPVTDGAAADFRIKREAACGIAAGFGFVRGGKDVADAVGEFHVGCRARTRRFADRRLIDFEEPVKVIHPREGLTADGAAQRVTPEARERTADGGGNHFVRER